MASISGISPQAPASSMISLLGFSMSLIITSEKDSFFSFIAFSESYALSDKETIFTIVYVYVYVYINFLILLFFLLDNVKPFSIPTVNFAAIPDGAEDDGEELKINGKPLRFQEDFQQPELLPEIGGDVNVGSRISFIICPPDIISKDFNVLVLGELENLGRNCLVVGMPIVERGNVDGCRMVFFEEG